MKKALKINIFIFSLGAFLLGMVCPLSAGDFTFNQTDWSNGQSATNVDITGLEPGGWKQFFSRGQIDIDPSGQLGLAANLSGNKFLDTTEAALDGFGGGKEFNFTKITGTGASAEVDLDVAAQNSLYAKLNGIVAGGEIVGMVKVGEDIYIAASTPKFLKYNPDTDLLTDLTSSSGILPMLWVSGYVAISAIAYDPDGNAIYFGGRYGKFLRYDITSGLATNLQGKISGFWGTTYENPVLDLVYVYDSDSQSRSIYLAGGYYTWGYCRFARYDITSDSATNLNDNTKIPNFSDVWGNYQINRLILDPTNRVIYILGITSVGPLPSDKLARYNLPDFSGEAGTYSTAGAIYNLANLPGFSSGNGGFTAGVFDSINNILYFGAGYGKFFRLNTSSYIAGGTYPNANTIYDLSTASGLSVFWPVSGSNGIRSLAIDSSRNTVYLGGAGGRFVRYNNTFYSSGGLYYGTANTAYNLNDPSYLPEFNFWSGNSISALFLDSAKSVVYLGGFGGKFARYNTTTYGSGGTYPSANFIYNLTSQVGGIGWGGAAVRAMFYAGNNIYLAGDLGRFAKYDTTTKTATDLAASSGLYSFWTDSIYALALDTSNNDDIYIGGTGYSAMFARYNITSGTATNLTSKLPSSSYNIRAFVFDSNNKTLYIGTAWADNSGYLYRYNTPSYVPTAGDVAVKNSTGVDYTTADKLYNLTPKLPNLPGGWVRGIAALAFDNINQVIYTGECFTSFHRYNTTSYLAANTPNDDPFCSLPDTGSAINYASTGVIGSAIGSPRWIVSLLFYPDKGIVYVGLGYGGGSIGRFGYYTPHYSGNGTESATTLTSKLMDYFVYPSSLDNTPELRSIAVDSSDPSKPKIYFGFTTNPSTSNRLAGSEYNSITQGGILGSFDPTTNALTLIRSIYQFWGANSISALALDSAQNMLYLGGSSGKCAKIEMPVTGSFTSRIYDTNLYPKFGTMTWTDNANFVNYETSVTLKVRASDKVDMSDKTEADWKTINNKGDNISGGLITDGLRYLQYKAELKMEDATISHAKIPALSDVTINYSGYPRTTGEELISSPFTNKDANNAIENLSWAQSGVQIDITEVKLQLRTAPEDSALGYQPNSSQWTDWLGPDGTNTSFYTDPAGSTIYSGHRDGVDDAWFQYKVRLSTKAAQTPVLEDITFDLLKASIVSYSVSAASPQDTGIIWPVTVTAKNINGNTVSTDDSTNVVITRTYSGTSTDSLTTYSDTLGSNPAASFKLTNGTVTFYAKSTTPGTYSIIATTQGGTATGSYSVAINAGNTASLTLNNPGDLTAGGSRKYTVRRLDASGNPTNQGLNTISLSSSSSKGKFSLVAGGSPITSIDIGPTYVSADFWYYDEQAGNYTITVSLAGVPPVTDAINVQAGPLDRLKIGSINEQKAGVAFVLPQIEAVDEYGNRVASYAGTKTINYNYSGTINAPDGPASGTDSWANPVDFVNGVSTTALDTRLYRAQDVTIAPTDGTLPRPVPVSFSIDPDTASKLVFAQQPQLSWVVNSVLLPAPRVQIQDQYGNKTADSYTINLFDSSTTGSYNDVPGGSLTNSSINAVNGEAVFNNLTYDKAGASIYLFAQGPGVTSAYSDQQISFSVGQSSTVETAGSPTQNFNLIPTNDTLPEKFEALKFKIKDLGEDMKPTLIDRIQVSLGGTGGSAGSDIGWAGLYEGVTQIATATSISNSAITFGSINGNGSADLLQLGNNIVKEFTVYIYMKNSKLTAVDKNTYAFDIDETGIGIDTTLGASSLMTGDSGKITQVTGTIKIDMTSLEVTADSSSVIAGAVLNITVNATDLNRNIDSDFSLVHTIKFSGLANVGTYFPMVNGNTSAFTSGLGINFTSGTSGALPLIAFKKEGAAVSAQESGKTYSLLPLGLTVSSASPASISLTNGDNQSAKVSGSLAQPLVATVNDSYGNPAQGVSVNFNIDSVPLGATDPVCTPSPATTDSSGLASTALTLGDKQGQYKVKPVVSGVTSPLVFTANAITASNLQFSSGNNQSAKVKSALSLPFVVKLAGPGSEAIPNEYINFQIISVPSGSTGEALSATSVKTDSSGLASTTLTLGDKTGVYTVEASYPGLSTVTFSATAVAEVPYKVVLSSPGSSAKAGIVSGAFSVSIQDQYGNNSNVSTATEFSLASTSQGVFNFYSEAGGTNVISKIPVAVNTNSAAFYYKDSATGNPNITVTRLSGQALNTPSASLVFNIIPADIGSFEVTGDSAAINAGASKAIIVKVYDNQGNLKTDAGNITVRVSGANPAPASSYVPSCSGIAFGNDTALTFVNGEASASLALYKAESAQIKVASGTVITPSGKELSFIVKHKDADHLKFAGNIPSPKVAGQSFYFETNLNAVDEYDNICDGLSGANPYNASKSISWLLSGTANSPKGDVDVFTNPVSFVNGASTTTLSATLYRAQITNIIASITGLSGAGASSNNITVNPAGIAGLAFSAQPSGSGITTQPLGAQPQVSISDEFDNVVNNASAKISLSASLTTGLHTNTNGTLSADSLSADTANGVAAFSNVRYSYPEEIYLEASASGYTAYSSKVTLSTAQESSLTAAPPAATEVASIATSSSSRVDVLGFKITDAGLDGFDTKIKRIIIRSSGADTTGGWSSYLAGAYITDGTNQFAGSIDNGTLTFGTAGSVIYSVANNTSKTYTVSIYLKAPLPQGADGKILGFSIQDTDFTLDALSSKIPSGSQVTNSSLVAVAATNFIISGTSTMIAGDNQPVTVKAIDISGNVDKDYISPHGLIFGGANDSPNGNKPVIKSSYNNIDTNFGDTAWVDFADGLNSSTITMTLYKAETANIVATEGALTTPISKALKVDVSGGQANILSWQAQPVSKVVAQAPWKEFSVAVTDAYGNVGSDNANITVTPSGASLASGAINTVATNSGVATFYNFAVTCSSYPGTVKLKAAAPSGSESAESNSVTVDENYTVKVNVKDYSSGGNLTEAKLNILKDGVMRTGFPMSGNSPFKNIILPYGTYTVSVTKDKYVEEPQEKTADVGSDALDGANDNDITWSIVVMSQEESNADYKIQNAFVYDESSDKLAIRLWLDRRGKLILNDDTNKLGSATVKIYDDETSQWLNTITLSAPPASDYTNGTYFSDVVNVVASGGKLDLVAGKTYFAKIGLNYGGLTGDARTYQGGATFTVSVTKGLKEVTEAIQGVTANIASQTASIKEVVKTEIEGRIKDVVEPKIKEVKDETAKILSATGTESLSDKITTMREEVVSSLETEIKPHVRSGILNRDTAVKTGSTIAISYRADSGLGPVIDVYDSKNNLKIIKGAMAEVGSGGIFEYNLKFDTKWGTGEFTVVCSESTQGTVDAIVVSVYSTDIEEVSGNIAAILGNTTSLGDIEDAVNTMNAISTQFNLLETVLGKISKDMVSKVGGTAANLETVYSQLVNISAQVKKLTSAEGIDLQKVYEVSKDKKEDIVYLKNKAEELKSAMEISKKMIDNNANKPVTQSWFEFR